MQRCNKAHLFLCDVVVEGSRSFLYAMCGRILLLSAGIAFKVSGEMQLAQVIDKEFEH
jgi:hypothetical protein